MNVNANARLYGGIAMCVPTSVDNYSLCLFSSSLLHKCSLFEYEVGECAVSLL